MDFDNFLNEFKISLKYHQELNKTLWDGSSLNSEVREKLLQIAEKWRGFTKVPEEAIQDIIITGGNCNYNYTPVSDIDIHLVVDTSKIPIDPGFLEDYYKTKKSLWGASHKITIKGYPVELYNQKEEESYHTDQGVYSIKYNEWVQIPPQKGFDFSSDPLLKKKIREYIKSIDSMLKNHASDVDASDMKDKLFQYRSSGIHSNGEFSFENLIFKELRNRGYVKKLSDYIKQYKDQRLSLESVS